MTSHLTSIESKPEEAQIELIELRSIGCYQDILDIHILTRQNVKPFLSTVKSSLLDPP